MVSSPYKKNVSSHAWSVIQQKLIGSTISVWRMKIIRSCVLNPSDKFSRTSVMMGVSSVDIKPSCTFHSHSQFLSECVIVVVWWQVNPVETETNTWAMIYSFNLESWCYISFGHRQSLIICKRWATMLHL